MIWLCNLFSRLIHFSLYLKLSNLHMQLCHLYIIRLHVILVAVKVYWTHRSVLQHATAMGFPTVATSTRTCTRPRATADTAWTVRATGMVPTVNGAGTTTTRGRTPLVSPATATKLVSPWFRPPCNCNYSEMAQWFRREL